MDDNNQYDETSQIPLMHPSEALKLIQKMIEGVNPLSDEAFKEHHFCLDSDIKRVLEATVPALEARIRWHKKQEELPTNAGKPWKEDEEKTLGEAFDLGDSIDILAKRHQRTQGSISSRLVKMGKLSL